MPTDEITLGYFKALLSAKHYVVSKHSVSVELLPKLKIKQKKLIVKEGYEVVKYF